MEDEKHKISRSLNETPISSTNDLFESLNAGIKKLQLRLNVLTNDRDSERNKVNESAGGKLISSISEFKDYIKIHSIIKTLYELGIVRIDYAIPSDLEQRDGYLRAMSDKCELIKFMAQNASLFRLKLNINK